jgi:hypothetical protein
LVRHHRSTERQTESNDLERLHGCRFPRITLNHNRPVTLLDADTPAARIVAGRQRITFNLVDLLAANIEGAHGRLDLVHGVNVNDTIETLAESEHGSLMDALAVS